MGSFYKANNETRPRVRGARKPKNKPEEQYGNRTNRNNSFVNENIKNEYNQNENDQTYTNSSRNGDSYEYEAPEMDEIPSIVADERGLRFEGESEYDQRPAGIHPASYGLVNPELQSYLKHCEETLDDMESFDQDMELFVERIHEEIKGRELQLMTDHNCSVVLEKILMLSKPSYLCYFMGLTRGQELVLMIHRFASHVLQTLFTLLGKHINNECIGATPKSTTEIIENWEDLNNGNTDFVIDETSENEKRSLGFEQLSIDFVNQTKKHFEFLVMNSFGSHVVRAILYLFSGKQIVDSPTGKGSMRSKKSVQYNNTRNKKNIAPENPKNIVKYSVPESFGLCLKELLRDSTGLMERDFVIKCALDPVGNPTLQIIIELLAEMNMAETPELALDQVLMGLISENEGLIAKGSVDTDDSGDNSAKSRIERHMKMLVCDVYGSRLMEKVFSIASKELFQKLYITCIRKNIKELCLDPNANFVIQGFLKSIRSSAQLLSVLEELTPEFENLFIENKLGIISALCSACVVNKEGYAIVSQNIIKVFCGDSRELRSDLIVNLALNKTVSPKQIDENTMNEQPVNKFKRVAIQSGFIIQKIFEFPNEHIKLFVKSLVVQDTDETLLKMATSTVGSRIIEAFLKAKYESVPIKQKRKVLAKFEKRYVQLSLDKFSSRIVDCCWNIADLNFKQKIANELIQEKETVKNSFFGKFVWQNCKIDLFITKNESWVSQQESSSKKKALFNDIFDFELVPSTKDMNTYQDSNSDDDSDADKIGNKKDQITSLGFSKSVTKSHKEKKELYIKDDIDELFKKRKRSKDVPKNTDKPDSENVFAKEHVPTQSVPLVDESLAPILDAISNSKSKKRKSKSHSSTEPKKEDQEEKKSRQKLSKKEKMLESKNKRKFF
ncbi:hypothetical protein BB559_003747 [Furculomyces boomerangus]|uniref:Nucleolar protein 9 n=1 Tax=Furculomyces boomerangus TaxID=61424 RepID=A0A2T9YJ34_9FUNG|nr:hypothetical protein BB559_003747 [Furculomyces boomerangus]